LAEQRFLNPPVVGSSPTVLSGSKENTVKRILMVGVVLVALVGCDRSRNRSDAMSGDYHVSTYQHDGCEFLVFKEAKGSNYETVAVVHSPKCKGCR
jgi:hypothetical protein